MKSLSLEFEREECRLLSSESILIIGFCYMFCLKKLKPLLFAGFGFLIFNSLSLLSLERNLNNSKSLMIRFSLCFYFSKDVFGVFNFLNEKLRGLFRLLPFELILCS